MNPLTERYPDLLGDQDDPALLACVADLDATCAVFTLPPEHDAAIARVLFADALTPVHPRERLSRIPLTFLPFPARRWRLASLLLAMLLVGSGLGVYLHGTGPTPVSAQSVLHRAAAAGPGPNLATHATYRIASSDGSSGTADDWTGYDGSGRPAEFGLTWTGLDPAQLPAPSVKGLPLGTQLAQQLSAQPNGYTVQQTTLDGVSVYALRADIGSEATYYFNTHSYVLEGIDWTQSSPSWHVRLASYATMPLSAVPSGTFPDGTGSGQQPLKP